MVFVLVHIVKSLGEVAGVFRGGIALGGMEKLEHIVLVNHIACVLCGDGCLVFHDVLFQFFSGSFVKIANALKISLDFLVGNTDLELDTETLKRVEDISKLSNDNKKHIYILLDALIRDFKTKEAYA